MYIDLSYYEKRYKTEKGHAFEYYCKDILEIRGFYDIEVTSYSGDYGIDIIGYYNNELYGIQCKYYESKVSNHAVEEAYSGGHYYGCTKCVVMTNNTFTDAAKEQASKLGVMLLDKKYFEANAYVPLHKDFQISKLYSFDAEIGIIKDYDVIADLQFAEEKEVILPMYSQRNALAVFTEKTLIDLYYLYQDEYYIDMESMLDFFVNNSRMQARIFGYYKYLEGKLYFYLDKVAIMGARRRNDKT